MFLAKIDFLAWENTYSALIVGAGLGNRVSKFWTTSDIEIRRCINFLTSDIEIRRCINFLTTSGVEIRRCIPSWVWNFRV